MIWVSQSCSSADNEPSDSSDGGSPKPGRKPYWPNAEAYIWETSLCLVLGELRTWTFWDPVMQCRPRSGSITGKRIIVTIMYKDHEYSWQDRRCTFRSVRFYFLHDRRNVNFQLNSLWTICVRFAFLLFWEIACLIYDSEITPATSNRSKGIKVVWCRLQRETLILLSINTFVPLFLQWALPLLKLVRSIIAGRGFR